LPLAVVEGKIYVQIEIKLEPPITEEQLEDLIKELDESDIQRVKYADDDRIEAAIIEFWVGSPEGLPQAIKYLQREFNRRHEGDG